MAQRTTFIGPDGKKYYSVAGMAPVPVEDVDGPQGGDQSFISRAGNFAKNMSPEIVAGLSAALLPETAGASSAIMIPALAAMGTKGLQNWSDTGEVNVPDATLRGAENLIPGAIGKGAGRFMPGSGTLTRGLEGMAQGDNWIGTIAKGLRSAMGSSANPAVTAASSPAGQVPMSAQIALLEQKLTDPRLNTTAKAAVLTALKRLQGQQSGNIGQTLRGVLGLGQGYLGDSR